MIAILNKAKGRVGVRGQAVIIILLGLIVAKLYPTLSMVLDVYKRQYQGGDNHNIMVRNIVLQRDVQHGGGK